MPRLPPTPHSMEANEPCLGRWVHDDASGLEGLVIEVKTGGWRVVLSVGGDSVNRRSGALEYAAGEPPAELRRRSPRRRNSVGARPRPRLSATTRRRRPRRRHRRPETWPRPCAARARTPPPRRRRRRTRTPSRATRCCRALCRPRQVPPFLRTRHTYLSHNYSKNQRFCAARSIAGASTSSARSRRFRAGEASAQAANRVPSRPSHAAADAASGGRASSGIAR